MLSDLDMPSDSQIDKFILDTLKIFYKRLLQNGLTEPKPISDKYRNPNPLAFVKVYNQSEMLLLHYMINEKLLAGVIKQKIPLLFKGSITQKGVEYLISEEIVKI